MESEHLSCETQHDLRCLALVDSANQLDSTAVGITLQDPSMANLLVYVALPFPIAFVLRHFKSVALPQSAFSF